MKIRVIPLESFKRDYKRLAKRYKQIRSDLKHLSETLEENPEAGAALSRHLYKIRVANSSIPKGKSGGFRTIYYYIRDDENLFLLAIYSKTQRESISEAALLELLKENGLPL